MVASMIQVSAIGSSHICHAPFQPCGLHDDEVIRLIGHVFQQTVKLRSAPVVVELLQTRGTPVKAAVASCYAHLCTSDFSMH